MKELTVIDGKGTFKITTKSTIEELIERLGSREAAYAAVNMLVKLDHVCDMCGSAQDVTYARIDKEYLCRNCMGDLS